MKNKFLFKALAVSLLLTLFSCSGEKVGDGVVEFATINPGYKQRIIDMSFGYLYEIITPEDTFLVFTEYQHGAVLLKHTPVKQPSGELK